MSSAYNLHLICKSSKMSQISLMNSKNKVGPSTLPCGTPLVFRRLSQTIRARLSGCSLNDVLFPWSSSVFVHDALSFVFCQSSLSCTEIKISAVSGLDFIPRIQCYLAAPLDALFPVILTIIGTIFPYELESKSGYMCVMCGIIYWKVNSSSFRN